MVDDECIDVGQRPRLCANVPEIGGLIKSHPRDFVVEEIPAYEPGGEGGHLFLWVEKRDVDGRSLIDAVARRFEISPAEIGTAGTKDRRAITRQWVSVPASACSLQPDEIVGPLQEGIEILDAALHKNKLRTGHVRGNRFQIRVRAPRLCGEDLAAALGRVTELIGQEGMPNYYGLQRFGSGGSTLKLGLRWLGEGRAPRGRFLRRMAASAVQSRIFNGVLAHRIESGTWRQVLEGDIFEKVDTGGRFWISADERQETQRRLDAGEITVTGPMPGSREGFASGEAGQLEREIATGLGIDEGDFQVFGRQARGTRRPLSVPVEGLSWRVEDDGSIALEFVLPAGSYATVLLRELVGELGGRTGGDYDEAGS